MAAFIRFWAAPLSTGPDVPQFWAFAKVFHDHGLDFYRSADATLDIFPYRGWGFVYPPIWLLLIGLALLFVPASLLTDHIIDTSWRLAEKFPIITADLSIGILLFWAVPGPKWRKLLFACLWLFHPTAWFESAVFGQFDAIAAAFLLASIMTLIKGKDRIAFLLAGFAFMTKQHTLIPIFFMLIICAKHMNKKRLLIDCSIFLGIILIISIPFLIIGNLNSYARSIFCTMSYPEYQSPLSLSFGGTGALLTYLHNIFEWDTIWLFNVFLSAMVIAFIVVSFLCFKRTLSPLQAALVGFLIFICFYFRVNYQYLIIYIILAIFQASQTPYRSEKIFALVLAFLPAIWVWLGNTTFWFHDYDPKYPWVTPILGRIGILDRYQPDYVYVALAICIASLSLIYIILVLTRWRQQYNQFHQVFGGSFKS